MSTSTVRMIRGLALGGVICLVGVIGLVGFVNENRASVVKSGERKSSELKRRDHKARSNEIPKIGANNADHIYPPPGYTYVAFRQDRQIVKEIKKGDRINIYDKSTGDLIVENAQCVNSEDIVVLLNGT